MAPRAEIKPVASLIPFTRFPGQDRISLLLWRFYRHTPLQSARFFHDLVIPSPPVQGQAQYQDACRHRDQLLCDYVDLCFSGLFPDLRKRIRSSTTVLRLESSVELILLPVNPVRPVESAVGTGRWVEIDQLLDRFRSSTLDCHFGDDLDVYLPTMAALREHAVSIVQHLERLGLNGGDQHALSSPDADDAGERPETPSGIARRADHYSCAKCSRALFNSDNVERHELPDPGRNCSSVFLSDSVRIFGDLAEVEGKLNCPHCGFRLGSYNWSGSPCSCGTWMAPAIQVTSSRVDFMPRRVSRRVPFQGHAAASSP